jgi:hypothetical protein
MPHFLKFMLVCCIGSFFPGCGSNPQAVVRENSKLKSLAIVYGRFLSQNRGQPPRDEAHFKQFLQSMAPAELQSLQVSDTNALFTSPRDNKPYTIAYGQPNKMLEPGMPTIVAYEQEGASGKRFVANSLGEIKEVTAAEFLQLVPGTAAS